MDLWLVDAEFGAWPGQYDDVYLRPAAAPSLPLGDVSVAGGLSNRHLAKLIRRSVELEGVSRRAEMQGYVP